MKRKRKRAADDVEAAAADVHSRSVPKKGRRAASAGAAQQRRGEEAPLTAAELEIWSPGVRIPVPEGVSLVRRTDPWAPQDEYARLASMKGLRSKLVRLTTEHCGKGAAKPMVLTFERWLARAALRRDPLGNPEPLIPADGVLDEAFVKDLSRAMTEEQARSVAEALTEAAKKAASRLQSAEVRQVSGCSGVCTPIEARKESRGLLLQLRQLVRDTRRHASGHDAAQAWESVASAAEKLKLIARRAASSASGHTVDGTAMATGKGDRARAGAVQVTSGRERGVVDVSLNGMKPYLSISAAHYAKMQRLYGRHGPADSDEHAFHEALFCCLARYEALKGAGYQCAVPGSAFDAVAQLLGPTVECFASPLNCRYERYCSAFGPLEAQFGSLGSFFDLDPLEGSFEANPPFVPEVMDAMLARIEALLTDSSRGALSFLVVVPAWGAGVKTTRNLQSSKHARASVTIDAAGHGFCDGAQHQFAARGHGRARHRPSSWDTAVTLVQNDLGAARWPLSTESLEATFVAAMRAATVGGPSLHEWERRGVARGGVATRKRQRRES